MQRKKPYGGFRKKIAPKVMDGLSWEIPPTKMDEDWGSPKTKPPPSARIRTFDQSLSFLEQFSQLGSLQGLPWCWEKMLVFLAGKPPWEKPLFYPICDFLKHIFLVSLG